MACSSGSDDTKPRYGAKWCRHSPCSNQPDVANRRQASKISGLVAASFEAHLFGKTNLRWTDGAICSMGSLAQVSPSKWLLRYALSNRAQRIMEEYLQPRPHDQALLNRLFQVLNGKDLAAAVARLLAVFLALKPACPLR